MRKTNTYNLISLMAVLLILGCSGGSDGDGGDKILPPEAASLILPANNEECNQGNIVSETESNVQFEWNRADNASSYTVILTNLNTNASEQYDSNGTVTSIKLLRGVPYSWQVVSKSNKTTTTASSDVWRFYNASAGISNYAPFPAELVAPAMGSSTSTIVKLEWSGSDIDNDIEDYEVYLGTTNPPTTLQTTTTNTIIDNLNLNANTVYYWKVITTDLQGNNSESPVFEFRTE